MVRQYRLIQGRSLALVKAVSLVILLGVLGVRHILLHSTPPPLLVLLVDNSLSSSFIFTFFPYLFKHSLATNCSSSTF